MKLIFAGTPDFAASILHDLLSTEYNVIAVFSQPDRPKGRGRKLTKSPVKCMAKENNIPVFQPHTLKTQEAEKQLQLLHADVMIVVAYGLLLPKNILNIPKYGCLNVHASLLPRWRGAAPIQRAIEAGDTTTGITIMQMNEGLDTGNMLKTLSCPITSNDTAQTLEKKLMALGSKGLIETLNDIQSNTLNSTPQDNTLATYAHKITKIDAQLDWQLSAVELDRKIRAFNPKPGAFTQLNNIPIKIWNSSVTNETSDLAPGTIINTNKQGIDVATGNGILRLLNLQFPGGKPLPVQAILNAKADTLKPGTKFNS